jgi:hypothetical protein
VKVYECRYNTAASSYYSIQDLQMRLSSLLVHCSILHRKNIEFKETEDIDLLSEGNADADLVFERTEDADLPFEDSSGLATGKRSQAKCPNEVFQW